MGLVRGPFGARLGTDLSLDPRVCQGLPQGPPQGLPQGPPRGLPELRICQDLPGSEPGSQGLPGSATGSATGSARVCHRVCQGLPQGLPGSARVCPCRGPMSAIALRSSNLGALRFTNNFWKNTLGLEAASPYVVLCLLLHYRSQQPTVNASGVRGHPPQRIGTTITKE